VCDFFPLRIEHYSYILIVKKAAPTPTPTPITPTGSTAKPNTSSTGTRSAKTDGVKGGTGDATRNKCVELIYDALVADATARTF
jgi:hypothetical protein